MRDLDLRDPLVRSGDVVVSASAGSGKTFTLTVLVTGELGLGVLRPWDLMATTFGEAAASDLRERLLRPLDLLSGLSEEAWAGLLEPLRNGDDLLHALDRIPLSHRLAKSRKEVNQAARLWSPAPPWTVSPCAARDYWRCIRREGELLRVSTIHALALALLRQGETPREILDAEHPALLRLLRQAFRQTLDLSEDHPDHAPARILLRWAGSSWAELSKAHDSHRDALGRLDLPAPDPARRALEAALDAAEAAFAPFIEDFSLACTMTRNGRPHALAKPSSIKKLPGPGTTLARRLAWAEAQNSALWKPQEPPKRQWSALLGGANSTLQPVADALEGVLRGLLAKGFLAFEALKEQRGFATFGDMVRRALEGLQAGDLTPPRPVLLLVDEYQDTSRVQDAFLAALGAPRTIRVGDLKQAIYGFRGGDPDILRERLEAAGDRAFRLPANHRSATPIVDLANTYVDCLWPQLDPSVRGLDGSQRPTEPSQGPVGFLEIASPGRGKNLAAFSEWIASLSQEAGWAQALGVPEAEGPRTRALLVPQRTGLARLLRRLKERGIRPYVLAKEGFWESPGVRFLLAALEAVARPERPAPAAVLLRRIAGLTDGELCALAAQGRGLPGLRRLDPAALPEARREKGAWLTALLGSTTQELAGHVLAEGSLLAELAALEVHGPMEPLRARRNLACLLSMLEGLPGDPALAWARLQEQRDGSAKGDVPSEASGADLLIPTVHGSKGLEYDDVVVPLLHGQGQSTRPGTALTDPVDRRLRFGWKLGKAEGIDLQAIKEILKGRARRDGLNLLYVALTRAKGRMVLLEQTPPTLGPADEAATWAEMGLHLQRAHGDIRPLASLPDVGPIPRKSTSQLELANPRPPLPRTDTAEEPDEDRVHGSLAARRNGEEMHAFVRDLLVRWEDPAAFDRCIKAAPRVPRAREMAQAFLAAVEARGWRHAPRRRTELPLEGSAASGALGRADLVVWEPDRIHLVDLKHSERFGADELAHYRAQLRRYADVLRQRHPGIPVSAWLVALRSGAWVEVEVRQNAARA